MPELGPYGSVRGARGNSRPYRESWISSLPRAAFGAKRPFPRMGRIYSASNREGNRKTLSEEARVGRFCPNYTQPSGHRGCPLLAGKTGSERSTVNRTRMTPAADVAVAGRTGPLCEASSDRTSTIASQAIVARCCSRTSDYTIVQRYTRERISYWLCGPAALELRRSQDGRNAVCLRRAEG
jgi:hypothetical protein